MSWFLKKDDEAKQDSPQVCKKCGGELWAKMGISGSVYYYCMDCRLRREHEEKLNKAVDDAWERNR